MPKQSSVARPTALTVLCVILIMIGASQLVHAFVAFGIQADARSLYGIGFSALALLSCYGLWGMRRWGVLLFVTVWTVNIVVLALFSQSSFLAQLRLWVCVVLLIASVAVIVPRWRWFGDGRTDRESAS